MAASHSLSERRREWEQREEDGERHGGSEYIRQCCYEGFSNMLLYHGFLVNRQDLENSDC